MAKYDFISNRFLKKNKKRSLSIIFTIIIAVGLITGILNYGLLYRELNLQEIYRKTGEYSVTAYDISDKKIEKINSNFQVEKTGEFKDIVKQKYNSTYLRNINLVWMDDKSIEINRIKLIKGNFPKEKNEVIVEKWMADYLNKNNIKDLVNIDGKDYTISGIIENRTGSRLRGEAIVITQNENLIKSDKNLYIKIKSKDLQHSINKLMKDNEINNYSINYSLLEYLSERNMFNYPVILLVFLLFVVSTASIMSIYNMSIIERIKDIGMIRSIGGTKNQIKKIIYKESFILTFIAIPFGLILGQLLPYLFAYIFGVSISLIHLNLYVLISVIIMAIFSAFISSRKAIKTSLMLTPIESIKKEQNTIEEKIVKENILSKIFKKLFGIKGKIAYKNLKRNGKKSTSAIFTMGLMVTLFITFSFVIKGMNSSFVTSQYIKGDYEIIDESRINDSGFTKEQIEDLSKYKNIKNIKLMKKTNVKFPYEENDIPEQYKSMAEKITKNDKEYYLLYSDMYGYSNEMLEEMESYLVSGKISLSIMENGNYVLIPEGYAKMKKLSVNDEIIIYKEDKEIKLKIAGIYSKIPYTFSYHNIGERLIISNKTFSQYFKDDKYKKIVVDVDDNIDESEMSIVLSQFASKVSGGQVISFKEEKENLDAQLRIISFIGNSIIISTLILSIFSLSNIINTNILLRTKEFGTMRALGLNKKELKTLISIEGISFGLIASFWGIIFGSIFGVLWFILMRITQDAFLLFRIPFLYILLTPLIVVFLGYLITNISVNIIKDKPIIEMIRNNE